MNIPSSSTTPPGRSTPSSSHRPWSLTLFSVRDIPIRIHVSFFLLLAYVAFIESVGGRDMVHRLLFVIGIFACVLLHELGHALTARLFLIKTRDIVLYPFGGIATLMMQGRPKEEFFIALAGPLVNLVLASGIGCLLLVPEIEQSTFGTILSQLIYTNLALAFFNLIPAFPMDGGRIFRSALAMCGIKKATMIAARLSQLLCIIMGIFAVLQGNIILIIISVLIFSNAIKEHLREKTLNAAIGATVREVMTDLEFLHSFTHGTTVSQALKVALKSFQSVFPVLNGGEVVGIVSRESLLHSGALEAEESYIASIMERHFITVNPDEPIGPLLERISTVEGEAILVTEQNRLIGMLIKDKVVEYLLVQEYRKKTLLNAEARQDDF